MPLLSTFGNASVFGFKGMGKAYNSYTLLSDTTVGTATTTVDFTGLNIGTDTELLLVSTVIASSAGNGELRLFVNGNTTTTNYYDQQLTHGGMAISGARQNKNYLTYLYANEGHSVYTTIKMSNNGAFSFQSSQAIRYGTLNIANETNYCTLYNATISSITSLTISSTVTNLINVNSRFQLYKINP